MSDTVPSKFDEFSNSVLAFFANVEKALRESLNGFDKGVATSQYELTKTLISLCWGPSVSELLDEATKFQDGLYSFTGKWDSDLFNQCLPVHSKPER